MNKCGYIDAGMVKMFFNQVLQGIVDHNQPVEVNCLDVCDEIFDIDDTIIKNKGKSHCYLKRTLTLKQVAVLPVKAVMF